ncbi:MAG: hypothetical protein GY927_01755 [bacterium]|nr:hypothetical protein [bacterium]
MLKVSFYVSLLLSIYSLKEEGIWYYIISIREVTMSNTVWIWNDDGTRQCEDGTGVSLDDMQKELESIGAKVLNAEKRTHCRFITSVCGAPTGSVNAYEVTEEDWEKLKGGFVGTLGFKLWDCADIKTPSPTAIKSMEKLLEDGQIPWPWAQISSVAKTPVLLREIIGRPCRCYHKGDALTEDFRPDRVNIELDQENRILDIWFG